MDDTTIFRADVKVGEVTKQIRVCCGDLCADESEYDVVLCSAFKGDYLPLSSTLIGGLKKQKGISVEELAKDPELRLKDCFISAETGTNFRRIACIELIEKERRGDRDYVNNLVLKDTFYIMELLLKAADVISIPINSIALPILGTGKQGIELYYMVSPLIKYCVSALENIDGLSSITIYDRDREKVTYVAGLLEQVLEERDHVGRRPLVFISYSSKDAELAEKVHDMLEENNIPCWKAPASIPPGSDYSDAIPMALSKVPIVLWILTPASMASEWVRREIGTAIGNRCVLLPFQMSNFELDSKTRFFVEGVQMIPCWELDEDELFAKLLTVVQENVGR